ncbi:hypothetical protein AB6A23_00960 [Paenibacillus tarimensis]
MIIWPVLGILWLNSSIGADETMGGRGTDDLVTERDIDPEFGLFTEEKIQSEVPDATLELEKIYPVHDVIRSPQEEQATEGGVSAVGNEAKHATANRRERL